MRGDTFRGRLVGALARTYEFEIPRTSTRNGIPRDHIVGRLIEALARTEPNEALLIRPREHPIYDGPAQPRCLSTTLQTGSQFIEAKGLAFRIGWMESQVGQYAMRIITTRDDPILVVASIQTLAACVRKMKCRLLDLTLKAASLAEFVEDLSSTKGARYARAIKNLDKYLRRTRDSALSIALYASEVLDSLKRQNDYRTVTVLAPDLIEDLTFLVPAAVKLALSASCNNLSGTRLIGLDLRAVSLMHVRFDGAIWSEATKWPVYLEDQIRMASREIEPGIFQVIGDGTAYLVAGPATF